MAAWASSSFISKFSLRRPTLTAGIPKVCASIEYIEKVGLAIRIEPSPPKQVAIKIERISSSEPLPTEIWFGFTRSSRAADSLTYSAIAFLSSPCPPSGYRLASITC